MKIIVFSDSHGDYYHMDEVVKQDRPDALIHLGDGYLDFSKLKKCYPDMPAFCVRGNCDGNRRDVPLEQVVELEGVRILMMHGHSRDVKMGDSRVIWAAREALAQVALYGHTHRATCEYHAGMWVMNPGTIGGVRYRPSYGVIHINDGDVVCYLRQLPY